MGVTNLHSNVFLACKSLDKTKTRETNAKVYWLVSKTILIIGSLYLFIFNRIGTFHQLGPLFVTQKGWTNSCQILKIMWFAKFKFDSHLFPTICTKWNRFKPSFSPYLSHGQNSTPLLMYKHRYFSSGITPPAESVPSMCFNYQRSIKKKSFPRSMSTSVCMVKPPSWIRPCSSNFDHLPSKDGSQLWFVTNSFWNIENYYSLLKLTVSKPLKIGRLVCPMFQSENLSFRDV